MTKSEAADIILDRIMELMDKRQKNRALPYRRRTRREVENFAPVRFFQRIAIGSPENRRSK